MSVTSRWMLTGRVVLSASALVILAAVPDILSAAGQLTRAALVAGIVVFIIAWVFFWWSAIDSANRVVTVVAVAALTAVLARPPGLHSKCDGRLSLSSRSRSSRAQSS